jgi:hypothetical protein
MSVPGFGVTMSCTASYALLMTAALASIRRHNDRVPVRVLTDIEGADLLRPVADDLHVQLVRAEPASTGVFPDSGANGEWIQSRLMKIKAVTESPFGPLLFLDSDVLLGDDVARIVDELGSSLATGADLLMLPAPAGLSLWEGRRFYFLDGSIERKEAIELINAIFGVDVPIARLDKRACWNSGVIFATGDAIRRVGRRWSELYRRMLEAPRAIEVVPRDQLALWVALWELRDDIRVGDLPQRWNFIAGHYLDLAADAPEVADDQLDQANVIHLAWSKADPWALKRISAALDGVALPPATPLPGNQSASWPATGDSPR